MVISQIEIFATIFVLLMLTTLLGAVEIAVIATNRIKIKQYAREGSKKAKILEKLVSERSRVLTSMLVWTTALILAADSIAAYWADNFLGIYIDHRLAVALSTLVLTFIILVMVEIVPRRIAAQKPETILSSAAGAINIIDKVTYPIVSFFVFITNPFVKLLGGNVKHGVEIVTEEEIREMVNVGQEQGVLEEEEKEMIHSIFEFGDTIAREVMKPRIDMICLEANSSISRVLDTSIQHGFSKIPVYDNSIDNIIGVVNIRDLLVILKDKKTDVPLKDILHKPFFIPDSKKVDDLLKEMQKDKISMAIVVDEFGGTAGLITIEDLIEEIVGEIADEYDKSMPPVEKLEDGSYSVDAKMIIEDVNDLVDANLSAEEFETIGGQVYGILGRVPTQGENVEIDNLMITVEKVHRQRITRLILKKKEN
ncbi:MAG: hemolysin family protein [Firmicutes bacterium]|nr:hemolysin family protein [Bacillota bacterium]